MRERGRGTQDPKTNSYYPSCVKNYKNNMFFNTYISKTQPLSSPYIRRTNIDPSV